MAQGRRYGYVGWASVPDVVERAAIMLTLELLSRTSSWHNDDGFSAPQGATAMPLHIRMMLAPYKRYSVGSLIVASGMRFDIKGLDAMTRGLGVGEHDDAVARYIAWPVWWESCRICGLQRLIMCARGYTVSRLKVTDRGKDGVEIGIPSDDTATHPASKRANARSVGVWLSLARVRI